jgi:hypothetical protein
MLRNRRKRSGGHKQQRRGGRKQHHRSRKLRGSVFPASDRSALAEKCGMTMCPMVMCDGELEYQHPMDCCGTCVANVEFPKTGSSGMLYQNELRDESCCYWDSGTLCVCDQLGYA